MNAQTTSNFTSRPPLPFMGWLVRTVLLAAVMVAIAATAATATGSSATKTVTAEIAGHGTVVFSGARPVACYPFKPKPNQLGVPAAPKGKKKLLCGAHFACASAVCGRVLRFPSGSHITATEIPERGWYFASWYGVCRYGNWATTCTPPPVAPAGQQYWGIAAQFQLPVPVGQAVQVGVAQEVSTPDVAWYQRVNGSTTASTAPGQLPAPNGKTYLVVESAVAYTTTTILARVNWKSFASGMQPRLWAMDPAQGSRCGTPGAIGGFVAGFSTIASVPAPSASGQWATFNDYFLIPSDCTNAYVLYRSERASMPMPPGVSGVSGFALH